MRLATTQGDLVRRGFRDLTTATALVEQLSERHQDGARHFLDLAGEAIDPDLALVGLARLLDADPPRVHSLVEQPAFASRVVAVLGGSTELSRGLVAQPLDVEVLAPAPVRSDAAEIRSRLLRAVGADPQAPVPVASGTADELRRTYRRELCRIAARDLTAAEPLTLLPDIAAELADLAGAVLEGALALARAATADQDCCRLAVVALGKTGAHELNYLSDVDVLFVAEPAIGAGQEPRCGPDQAVAIGTRLAATLSRICSEHSAAGAIWAVDSGLRPEGKAGPLVRTLASMEAYYTRWATSWEFQAMLKARPAAGDLTLGQAFCDLVSPLVWAAGEREGFIHDTQAMRQRVISLIPARDADREIKLGSGGLRDTEFSVQLLQLVHGRADERLRLRGTLPALERLVEHGYVGREDGRQLGEAYRFQRLLEHRVQLYRMRRSHLLPDDPDGLRMLARATRLSGPDEVLEQWRHSTRVVRRLHRRIFYSPLLEAVARIPTAQMRLTPEAAQTRLLALGYADPAAALRHLQALTTGITRSTEIQRQLLPAMLGWFTEGCNPDHGLLAFRQICEALGNTPWYLRALRDEGAVAQRLARIVSSSRYAVDLLRRAPQQVELLTSDEQISPRPGSEISRAMSSAVARHPESAAAVEAVQSLRRRELLRVVMADLLGDITPESVGAALSEIATATAQAMLELAAREVGEVPPIGIVACGSWGGGEVSYGSDLDALFVIGDGIRPQAQRQAVAAVTRLRALLRHGGGDVAISLDPDLRPEGRNGPLVRSLGSYRAYYDRWSATWEAQALLRATPAAGDHELAARLVAAIDPVRYPQAGLSAQQLVEIRRLKARMETERMPRGVDPRRHLKLGPGGRSDVEWVVQLVQMRHAGELAELRTPKTLPALTAAVTAGLVGEADAAALRAAWLFAGRIRNASMLVRGRPSDLVPTDGRELGQVAQTLGYGRGGASHLLEDWGRVSRHAKQVVDRLLWASD